MQPVTLNDLLNYRFLSALAMSPDGKRAVFCAAQADAVDNNYKTQLWLHNTETGVTGAIEDTKQVRSFIFTGPDTILFPQLRLEEDKTFVSKGGWRTVFQQLDLSDGSCRELFRVPLKGAAAQKISDSLYLISAIRDNARPDIESMSGEEQEEALKLLKQEEDFEVCDELPFMYDGRGFINKERHALWLYDCAAGELTELTEPSYETGHFAVSPDGSMIAISGVAYDRYYIRTHGIYLYDVATGRSRTLLTPGSYQIMGVDFMGDELVVAAAPWNGEGSFPNHNLYTLPLSGGKMRLRHTHTREDFGGKTCSDCRYGGGKTYKVIDGWLYYFTTCDTAAYLNRWKPGLEPERLSLESFVPENFAVAPDGGILSIGMTTGLQELFAIENGEAIQLTDFNGAALAGRYVAKPRKHQFVDQDGFTVSGFVLEPINYDPAKKYPGILEIHGGPRASFSTAFFHEMQALAGMGYFVFYCNPRGSSGCGEAFADIRNCRGGADYRDVMEWTDYVLEQYPAIDCERLGVMGGSYGGYMTNWVITHTRRFRAAVSMRSIVDVVGGYGATDFGVWGTPGVYGGTPWSNAELLREQSPLTYAMNVTTPTLFLHSFEDFRCNLGGAMQLYSALQIKGVPTRMCLFRNSCHELSRSGLPRSRMRRLKELTDWVDQYLV